MEFLACAIEDAASCAKRMYFASFRSPFKLAALIIAGICLATTHSFAIDQNEMQAALDRHTCPTQMIDTTNMPNYGICTPLEKSKRAQFAVNDCQNEQDRIWHLAEKYNEIYRACHSNESSRGRGATDLNELIGQAKARTNAAQTEAIQDRAQTLQGEREAVETLNSLRMARERADQERRRQAEERAAQEEDQVEPAPPHRSPNRVASGRACFASYQECLHDCMRTTGNEGSAGFCGMCSTQNGENCYRKQ